MRRTVDRLGYLETEESIAPTTAQRNDFLTTVPVNTEVLNTRLSANRHKLITGITVSGYIYDETNTAYVKVHTGDLWHINEVLPLNKDLTTLEV